MAAFFSFLAFDFDFESRVAIDLEVPHFERMRALRQLDVLRVERWALPMPLVNELLSVQPYSDTVIRRDIQLVGPAV